MNAKFLLAGRYRQKRCLEDQDLPTRPAVLVGKVIDAEAEPEPAIQPSRPTTVPPPEPHLAEPQPVEPRRTGTAIPQVVRRRRQAYALVGAAMVVAVAAVALGATGNPTSAASRPGTTGAANSPAQPAPAPVPAEPAPVPVPDEPPDSRRSIKVPGQQKQEPRQPSARPSAPLNTLTVDEGLAQMERVVDDGDTADQIRADVALDLDNVIDELQDDLKDKKKVKVDKRLDEIRDKIAKRLGESAITKARADQLNGILARIET